MERQGVGLMKKRYGFLLFGFVILIWASCWYFLTGASWLGIPYELSDIYLSVGERGTFGDMFGAVNSLFSGLAFAGLICTLIVQMKELKAQREELSDTRKVMEDQKEVMDQQREQISIQNFESGFFQVLKMHYETIDELEMFSQLAGRASHKGRRCFMEFAERIYKSYQRSAAKKDTFEDKVNILIHEIDKSNQTLRVPFSSYGVSIISLFEYIENSGVKKYQQYIDLIVSRMTDVEKICLAYQAVTQKKIRLLEIVTGYDVLEGSYDLILNEGGLSRLVQSDYEGRALKKAA